MTLEQRLAQTNNNYPQVKEGAFRNDFSCSFIIPMYNTESSILMVLGSIEKQTDVQKIKEVILINDNSTDLTYEKVKQFKESSNLKIEIINNAERLSAAKCRNLGLEQATGEIIFFLDSDLIVPPNYVYEHCRIHTQITNCIAISFRSYIKLESFKRKKQLFPITKYRNEFRLVKKVPRNWYIQKGLKPPQKEKVVQLEKETKGFRFLSAIERNHLWTLPEITLIGASSVKKKTLKEKKFNENFTGWGYEDIEFAARIIADNNYVIPVPNSGTYHITHAKRLTTANSDFDRNFKIYTEALKS